MEYIKYHKWNIKDNKNLINSCKKYLNINDIQIYFPILSLYFYIHNTKNANKIIDINRRYYLLEFTKLLDSQYFNSNTIHKCIIFDSIQNRKLNKLVFTKCIPLLDPMHYMMNNYNINKENKLLPNNYTYNTQSKINNMNNSSYIDTFFSYLVSELTINKILPTFAIFYGSINGIKKDYKLDITDEYYEYNSEKWFDKYLGKLFNINLYISNKSSDNDSISTSSTISSNNNDDDEYICEFNNFPVQYLFIEKLEGTLEDFLKENINNNIILSCLFQIIFALCYLQKYYDFTHNDLHINNIMYEKTNIKYLYYKYNNSYYKIPTYGNIFKIIDFGRSIFKYKNKLFFNDVFSKYGEAEGQYNYPLPSVQLYDKNKYENNIKPNYSFDMCRLSTTILEELDKNYNYKNNKNNSQIYEFLNYIVTDINNNNIYINKIDNFDLYINIAKYSCNGIPSKLIFNDIFNIYKIKKKMFPINGYYSI
jgi:hypothetical protein